MFSRGEHRVGGGGLWQLRGAGGVSRGGPPGQAGDGLDQGGCVIQGAAQRAAQRGAERRVQSGGPQRWVRAQEAPAQLECARHVQVVRG